MPIFCLLFMIIIRSGNITYSSLTSYYLNLISPRAAGSLGTSPSRSKFYCMFCLCISWFAIFPDSNTGFLTMHPLSSQWFCHGTTQVHTHTCLHTHTVTCRCRRPSWHALSQVFAQLSRLLSFCGFLYQHKLVQNTRRECRTVKPWQLIASAHKWHMSFPLKSHWLWPVILPC